ncbi:hypothetical protein B0H13DRAFT_1890537 [Mycena leptocephala]|nr:hypothetical protein B0H13DRAFT_1890537 [Mycena leptocephala]
MSVQAREIRNKRRDPRRKQLRAPKTVQVRQDKVQVRRKPKSGEPSDRFTVRLMRLLICILSSHHHLLPPCVNSRRFRTAMDEWQFSPHSTSEAGQRHRVPDTSASTVGVMQSFTFPGTSDPGFSTDISHLTPLLPADLFPGVEQSGFFSALNSRDSELFALLQAPEQMSTRWDDPAVQPDWDNLVSSLQSAQTRPPSTDSSAADFFYDGYG